MMIKRLISFLLVAVNALIGYAQTPLSIASEVRHGVLDNGLNYYILHNEKPEGRANFYLAQKVGSTLETQEQLGLAHFLEHMAFNGTKNFPGHKIMDFLKSKGIQDFNAATNFDETVYMIENVPVHDKLTVDSILLILHDWSGNLLLEDSEIEAERGVIEEEWRSRNSAMQRMRESLIEDIFDEYQYQQFPIGKMEVVRNFPAQVLRDYYHKWYRPDLQGIVVVGDFDVDDMEKQIIATFSDIVPPENPAQRIYPAISDNIEPRYSYYSDKEFPTQMVMIAFKKDKTPFEMRNTLENFVQTKIAESLISKMINQRLNEFAKDSNCQYIQAEVAFEDFLVAKTKYSFNIQIIAKNDVKEAMTDAMGIVARACKSGFTETELERAKKSLLSEYEKSYNERNTTSSQELGQALCMHFIDNDPFPGIESEYQMVKQFLPMIPVQAFNQKVSHILTDENQVIIVAEPERKEMNSVSKDDMVATLKQILDADYDTYIDETITTPLIETLPQPGTIVSETKGKFGTTIFTLSNGVKVIVKPTDYKSDEILLSAYMNGGKKSFDISDASNVLMISEAFGTAKLGKFNRAQLDKYLIGKNVKLTFDIDKTSNRFDGKSSTKDLKTLMELIYASFTLLHADEQAYETQMDIVGSALRSYTNNPNIVFKQAITEASYGNNPMFQEASVELIADANYTREIDILHKLTNNAAEYTFVFVGNVNLDSVKPLLEQYVATLPSEPMINTTGQNKSSISIARGLVDKYFDYPMQTPISYIFMSANGTNVDFCTENMIKMEILGAILNDRYMETLREEEGGTYSPYAYGSLNPYTRTWEIVSIIQTNPDIQDKILSLAKKEFLSLLDNGVTSSLFNKAKESIREQYKISLQTNEYWSDYLIIYEDGYDAITNVIEVFDGITLPDFNNFIKDLYNGENLIQVVMRGKNV